MLVWPSMTQCGPTTVPRSEEHTSELQSLMRISYAVFCLKKKNQYYISSVPVPVGVSAHVHSNAPHRCAPLRRTPLPRIEITRQETRMNTSRLYSVRMQCHA